MNENRLSTNSGQVILLGGLTEWLIFRLNEWLSDSASEAPTHRVILTFIDVAVWFLLSFLPKHDDALTQGLLKVTMNL